MSNYGHNEAAVRLAALAGDAQVALDRVARGEADAIEGWLAYGAALNEGRALFPSDEKFGQWADASGLSQLGTHEIKRDERAAAMWAAANADQLAEAQAASRARTLRGWHDQWKKIEQEREAARKKAEREAEEARKRETARQEAKAQAKAEQEAREAAAAARTEGERQEAEAKAEQAATAKAEAERVATATAPEHPEEDPATAKARRELSKLTPEALIDDVLGLRADLADERAKRRAAEAKVADLKEQIAVFEADHDMGAKLSAALNEIRKVNGRMKEIQTQLARETRRANFLEKERNDLRAKLESQVIPL